ncbi:MAG: VWA domain-containing protein [bacterium]
MALDLSNYQVQEPKALPVVLLLDVSGSMSGDKINCLYDATINMIESFANQILKETIINVSIITFGAGVAIHTPYTSVSLLRSNGITRFNADGMTPLGGALKLCKNMLEDKDETPSNIYRPAIVLVSDGQPNDSGWEQRLEEFINSGRSSKCQRYALAIGADVDREMLKKFSSDESLLFEATEANDIVDSFEKITMSVSNRYNSVNPNDVSNLQSSLQGASQINNNPISSIDIDEEDEEDDDDDDDF